MKRTLTLTIVGVGLLTFCFFVQNVEAFSGERCSYSKQGSSYGGGDCQKSHISDSVFYKAGMLMAAKDEIGLTDAQVDQIKVIKLDFKKTLVRLEADIEVLGLDVKKGLYENPVDVDAVNALIDQKYAIKIAKAKASVQALADVKSVVTDEQWTKLKELKRDKFKEHGRDEFHKR